MTAIAVMFASAVAGVVAWRFLSLRYPPPSPVEIDPASVREAISRIDDHEKKLNALMLSTGLRNSRETRV